MKRIAWLLLGVLLVVPCTARAQKDEVLVRAKALYVQGMKSFNQGQFARAAESILKARDILRARLKNVKSPELKQRLERAIRAAEFNLAIIYYKMHRPIQSVTYLRHFLEKASAKERRDVPAEVMAQQSKVGVLIVRAPSDEATIWIEGRYVGRRQVELVMPPGTLHVSIKVNDRTVASKTIDILPGTQPIWEVATLQPRQGSHPRGRTIAPRGAGRSDVGAMSRAEPVGGSVGDAAKRPGGPKKSRKLHWAYFAAAAGLAAVLGGATVFTGVKTLRLKDDFDKAADQQEKHDLKSQGLTYRTATNALIGVTAVVAAGAVVLAVFTEWKKPSEKNSPSSWRILPSFGPKGAVLTLEWSR